MPLLLVVWRASAGPPVMVVRMSGLPRANTGQGDEVEGARRPGGRGAGGERQNSSHANSSLTRSRCWIEDGPAFVRFIRSDGMQKDGSPRGRGSGGRRERWRQAEERRGHVLAAQGRKNFMMHVLGAAPTRSLCPSTGRPSHEDAFRERSERPGAEEGARGGEIDTNAAGKGPGDGGKAR